METAELRLVLQNCFTPERLREYVTLCSDDCDLYEAAIESILSEDEIGRALVQKLNQESERQRDRIRSLSSKELRSQFTFEFLEPGRTLGYIVWALMRDDRFIARNLAGEIVEYFTKSFSQPAAQAAHMELTKDTLPESPGKAGVSPNHSGLNQYNCDTLEIPNREDNGKELASSIPTQPYSGERMMNMDSTQTRPAFIKSQKETQSTSSTQPRQTERVLKTPRKQDVKNEDLVLFKEVEIALTSMKRACELLFNEPIELVADPNITEQDKIVLVGKQCGVKLLYGPQHVIRPPVSTIEKETKSVVFAASLQAALSRIYDEPVELIPDPELLQVGIVPFAGKKVGIKVMENEKISVTVPAWADSINNGEKPVIQVGQPVDLTPLLQKIETLEKRISFLEQPATVQYQPAEPDSEPEKFRDENEMNEHESILNLHSINPEKPECQVTSNKPVESLPDKNLLSITPIENSLVSLASTAVEENLDIEIPKEDFKPKEFMKTGKSDGTNSSAEENSIVDEIEDSNRYENSSKIVEPTVPDITPAEFSPQDQVSSKISSIEKELDGETPDLMETETHEDSEEIENVSKSDLNLEELDLDDFTMDLLSLKAEAVSEEENHLKDLNKVNEYIRNDSSADTPALAITSTPISTIEFKKKNRIWKNLVSSF